MPDDENSTDSEGIKNLRKQFEDQAKQLKAVNEQLAKYQSQERQSTVADILKAKGVNPKAASLYSGEDVSEDAVSKWAQDYAEVFGAASASEGSGQQSDANAQAAARVAGATFSIPQSRAVATDGRVLGDPNEILHAIKTLPMEELVKLGYMPSEAASQFLAR